MPPISVVVQSISNVAEKIYGQLSICVEGSQPPPTDFGRTTVVAGLCEPTDLRFPTDNLVVINEKGGAIKLYDMGTPPVPPTTLVTLPVGTASDRRRRTSRSGHVAGPAWEAVVAYAPGCVNDGVIAISVHDHKFASWQGYAPSCSGRRGAEGMCRKLAYLIPLVSVGAALGIVVAPAASADCNYSGGSTLCSSTGSVRGGSAPAPAFDPYPCSYGDPLCAYYDDWDPQIYIDLSPIDRPVRPGRPGRG